LTVREAVVAVSQHTASIAALPKPDQDEFLDRAEASEARLVVVRHQHQRAKHFDALELAKAAPPPVHPRPERRKRLLKNGKEHRMMLVIGPNAAGLHLDKYMRKLKEGEQYRLRQDEIADLNRSAEELERRAAALRKDAKQRAADLAAWAAAVLTERHGQIDPFIETATYELDAETFCDLSKRPEQEAVAALLDRGAVPLTRGYWGDIRHLHHFGMPQPASEWTHTGNEHGLPSDIVASILPSGEAAS
jgi:hypothetical protein